jgi:hypothetical protein
LRQQYFVPGGSTAAVSLMSAEAKADAAEDYASKKPDEEAAKSGGAYVAHYCAA